MTFNPITVAEFRARVVHEGAEAVARDLRSRAGAARNDHAFTLIDEMAFAKIGDRSSGGALAGVPIAVKDNIDVLPFPTTGASPALLDHMPRVDAPVVTRLRTAGAVIIGKTSLHELAFGITSNNAHFGAMPNPFDATRVPGGSSGGSALVLARGVVPLALGSDTGGSARIPAAFCNVVGLRPTTGRYPGEGVLNLSPTRDTIGPMATTIQDVAALDAVISGETAHVLDGRPLRLRAAARLGLRYGLSRFHGSRPAPSSHRRRDRLP
jgi:mandelamide amidase